MGLFYYDWTILVLLPALVFSVWASAKVNSTFNKYNKVYSRRGYTAAMACRAVLDANGLDYVRIEHIAGNLTDHYDPREQVIRLSDTVYNSTSTAAIGVACHEAGHAVQHAEQYLPIKIRQAIIPVTNIGSKLGLIIFMIGILLVAFGEPTGLIAVIGIGLFSLTAIFQLVTLPTEFNASRRAIRSISDSAILDREEIVGAKKVLTAAALTYVAALAASLSQILRLLLILGNTRRRD